MVLEEVMHAQPEIVQAKLAKVFARNGERIEIVLVEIATVLASFLVFPPEKTGGQQDERGDDRRDYINRNVAAESFDHMRSEGRASSGPLKALSVACRRRVACSYWRDMLLHVLDAQKCVPPCKLTVLHPAQSK